MLEGRVRRRVAEGRDGRETARAADRELEQALRIRIVDLLDQLERVIEHLRRLGERTVGLRLARRRDGGLDRLGQAAGLLEVLCQQPGVGRPGARDPIAQGIRDPRVALRPRRRQLRLIGELAEQVVTKMVDRRLARRPLEQARVGQRREVEAKLLIREIDYGGEQIVADFLSDAGERLDQAELDPRGGDPGEQRIEQRRRDRGLAARESRRGPAARLLLEAQELLEVEGNPVASAREPLHVRRRHPARRGRRGGDPLEISRRQRPELDRLDRAPGGLELVAAREQDEDARGPAADDPVQQLDRRRIRPLDVVDDQRPGRSGRLGLDPLEQCRERRLTQHLAVELRPGELGSGRDADQGSEERQVVLQPAAAEDLTQAARRLVEPGGGVDTADVGDHATGRIEVRGRVKGRAAEGKRRALIDPHPGDHRLQQSRFSDPGLAADDRDLRAAGEDLPPEAAEPLALVVAVDEAG